MPQPTIPGTSERTPSTRFCWRIWNGNGQATWQEFGHQLRAGPTLTATRWLAGQPQVALAWTVVETGHWTPAPGVTYTVARDNGILVDVVAEDLVGSTFIDTDVTTGTGYTYQVAAVVDGGEAARSAHVTAEVGCAVMVAPLRRDVLWTAATEQVTVTTVPGCVWAAASESAFLVVTAGAVAAGSAAVSYTVAANAGRPRTGALVVAGQRVTVYQASPTVFTDHPIERGVTPVKAIHFLELRTRIDALREGAGRAAFRWTDATLTPGVTPIKRVHLTELRTALAEAYAAAGRAAPAFPDPAIMVKAAHVMELRAALAALE